MSALEDMIWPEVVKEWLGPTTVDGILQMLRRTPELGDTDFERVHSWLIARSGSKYLPAELRHELAAAVKPQRSRTMTFQKPTGREVRVATDTWPLEDVEVRAEGDGMTFRGYAAVFNSWSEDLGGFKERIIPGAFSKSIAQKRAIKMFHNHNSDIVLGSTRAKTLTLVEDERGLHAEALLPDNYWGVYVRDAVKRGDIDSMSFGFQVPKGGDTWSGDMAERELSEVRLFEVSDVSGWPAYSATSASVRELAEQVDEDPDELAEAFKVLRAPDARLSASQATLLTKLINARTDAPLRRVFTPEEASIYAAFEAALS